MENMQNKTRKKKDGRKMEKSISDIRKLQKVLFTCKWSQQNRRGMKGQENT